MKKILQLFLFLVITNTVVSQAKVLGHAPGAEGKLITIKRFSELITFTDERLDACFVDDSANFSFYLPQIKSPTLAVINIGYNETTVFLEPNSIYEINFVAYDYDTLSLNKNPFLERVILDYSLKTNNKNNLNDLLYQYDSIYSNFVTEKRKNFVTGNVRGLYDSLKTRYDSFFKGVHNPYLQTTLRYNLAKIKLIKTHKYDENFIKEYLLVDSIPYNNIEFMSFFNNYFHDYILNDAFPNNFENKNIKIAIDDSASFVLLDSILSHNAILNQSKQLRELVLLNNITEFFQSGAFDKDALLEILLYMKDSSSFKKHRLIAKNQILNNFMLTQGFKAPGFYLLSNKDSAISSYQFRGKYVLLNFWTSYCTNCQSEFYVVDRKFDKFSDSLQIVSISADLSIVPMQRYLENVPFDWTFLYCGDNVDFLNKFGIKKYPHYMLLDKDGYILLNPAALPSDKLEEKIYKHTGFIREKNRKRY